MLIQKSWRKKQQALESDFSFKINVGDSYFDIEYLNEPGMKLQKCDFHIPSYQSYYTRGTEYTSWPQPRWKTNEEKALRLSWGGVHQTEEPK